jgi:hypothetical protein
MACNGAKAATRHTRKFSVALINIVLGKNCLVRYRADASKFFRGSCNFFREKFGVFSESRSLPQSEDTQKTLQNTTNARNQSYARRDATVAHESSGLSRFLLCRCNVTASRLFGPASPTASPESESLSHGSVASRGVCKGAPHKF